MAFSGCQDPDISFLGQNKTVKAVSCLYGVPNTLDTIVVRPANPYGEDNDAVLLATYETSSSTELRFLEYLYKYDLEELVEANADIFIPVK